MQRVYDVVIIGGGPSGVSTALYTVRGGLKTAIITRGYGALAKAEKIENYYGFPEGIKGDDLIGKGLEQAKTIGIDVWKDEVVGIAYSDDDRFVVKTLQDDFIAATVVLCCGSSRLSPNIPGIAELDGKGVSYCAVCDGFFYRNKRVVVIGNGDYAVEEAEVLRQNTPHVTICTDGHEDTLSPLEIAVDTRKIARIHGSERVSAIEYADGSKEEIDGIFIALGVAGSTALAMKLGALAENGKVVVDENMATNIPNLYAAGDCVGGIYQVSKAVYEGTKAGLDIIKQQKRKK